MTRAPRQMLAAAAACVAAFWVLLGLAYGVGPAEWADASALDGFVSLHGPRVDPVANAIAHLFSPGPYAILVVALLAYALLKRGLRHAAAAALLLAGANVSSQVLKPLLAHHRNLSAWDVTQLKGSAFPSGHATASMALAFAAVLVAPRAYRPVVAAAGGVVALAVAVSILVLNWHFPSDVVGGQLLAATWCLVALAALRFTQERWPERGSMRRAAREAIVAPSPRALLAGGLAVAVTVTFVAATKASAVVHFAHAHTTAVAVGAAIAASAVALLAGVTTLAVRR